MDDGQREISFEWIEVSIAVQQRALLTYTKRGDETIDRFPDRMAAAAQGAIIPHRLDGQFDAAGFKDLQLQRSTGLGPIRVQRSWTRCA